MFYSKNKFVGLSKISRRNIKNINGTDFRFRFIDPNNPGSKGGNSSVFIISNAQVSNEEYAIKISNIHEGRVSASQERKKERFEREIEALKIAKNKSLESVISIIDDGIISIKDREDEYDLRFYIMEKADKDLKEYVLSGNQLDVQEKIQICANLCNSIDQLNNIDIYHRDIKPDNIFNILELNLFYSLRLSKLI